MSKMTVAAFAAVACLVAVAADVPADYVEGEKSAELISPEVQVVAEQMMGRADAAKLLHAIRLQMTKYDRDMQSKSGRQAWHGKMIVSEVYTNELVAVEVYSNEVDGAVWRYKVPWNRPNPKAEVVRANAKLPKPVITNGIPARLAAARLRRQAEKETVSNVTERVTVNLPGVQ